MNILITGGAGFIGSNLARELMKDNNVTVFDDFSTAKLNGVQDVFENLQSFNFTGKVIMGDILDFKALCEVIEKYKIEQIYHLAATSSSQMFDKNLKKAIKTNVTGTLNVLEAAKKNKIKRVVYASTSTIYAANEPPYDEDMKVTPMNFYSFTKLANEQMAQLYAKEGFVETVGCRFFSVYGPNDGSKGAYANLMTQFLIGMKKGVQPTVYGDGKQTRDFIHVEDLCKGLIQAMNKEGVSGEVFNLGTGIATTILDLVVDLNKLIGTDLSPEMAPNPIKGYVYKHQANTNKMTTILDFKPEIILSEGLKKMKEVYIEGNVGN